MNTVMTNPSFPDQTGRLLEPRNLHVTLSRPSMIMSASLQINRHVCRSHLTVPVCVSRGVVLNFLIINNMNDIFNWYDVIQNILPIGTCHATRISMSTLATLLPFHHSSLNSGYLLARQLQEILEVASLKTLGKAAQDKRPSRQNFRGKDYWQDSFLFGRRMHSHMSANT